MVYNLSQVQQKLRIIQYIDYSSRLQTMLTMLTSLLDGRTRSSQLKPDIPFHTLVIGGILFLRRT
jgi:hypothetical protein